MAKEEEFEQLKAATIKNTRITLPKLKKLLLTIYKIGLQEEDLLRTSR